MKILGCDLHAKQQSIAMVDTETAELAEKTLSHEGNEVREFYAALEGPVVVGIEATGAMQWFLELLEELGIVVAFGELLRILPDDGNGLGRRNVVPGSPVFFPGDTVEVLLDDLLSPRQSITPAHHQIL
jgi:hypothetical protein